MSAAISDQLLRMQPFEINKSGRGSLAAFPLVTPSQDGSRGTVLASQSTHRAKLTAAEIKSIGKRNGIVLGGWGNQEIWAGEEGNIWDSKNLSGACRNMG